MSRLTRPLAGWVLPLRVARRDALRARGRSALVLVMIALPVLAVTAAIVVQRTSDVSASEAVGRTLGTAQARVQVDPSVSLPQLQDADGSQTLSVEGAEPVPVLDAAGISGALGGARTIALDESETRIQTDAGVAPAVAYVGEVADPLVEGILVPVSGRRPTGADEVAVNQAVLDRGYAVGEPLRLADDPRRPTIVGVVASGTARTYPVVAGPAGSLPVIAPGTSYLVDGDPVTWSQVRALNTLGGVVVSRSVLADPPPPAQIPAEVRGITGGGLDPTTLTVLALVVVMALLEVVLLAGPAFAVGARRLQRTLALMAAAGGTPAQARRVVVAGAVVLGSVAAAAGALLGILLALALLPLVQRLSDRQLGPFEVPLAPVLAVAGLGLLSAVLAAVVPAWIASRQDVVAVLAGRRGDPAPSRRSPVVGMLLLGAGVGLAALGATGIGGELLIAGAAVVAVLGMVLLVPLVVAVVARLATRLPLTLRYAARDAARHRTRTAPAVAAVAATVAGVVALLVANTSDGAENQALYTPSLAAGVGVVSLPAAADPVEVQATRSVLERELPQATVTPVLGDTAEAYDPQAATAAYTQLFGAGDPAQVPLVSGWGTAYGASLLVSDGPLPPGLPGLAPAEAAAARAVLADGGMVAFADPSARAETAPVTVRREVYDTAGGPSQITQETLPALVVPVSTSGAMPLGVVSPAVAERLDVPVGPVGLAVTGTVVSPDAETAVSEGVAAVGDTAWFYVERGYQGEQETLILQLVLLVLGGVLVLGGTLTATFLALSDARPDLATLAAVGASPGRRRGIAAGYALVVGLVGAVLGALVGLVPGVAIAVPLTSSNGNVGPTGPYVDVPWLMLLALVVGLPALTAAVVALTARSRLPLATRLD